MCLRKEIKRQIINCCFWLLALLGISFLVELVITLPDLETTLHKLKKSHEQELQIRRSLQKTLQTIPDGPSNKFENSKNESKRSNEDE